MPRKRKDTALVASEKGGKLNWRESKALQDVFESVPEREIVAALIESGNDKAVQLAERLTDGQFSRANLAKHCAALDLKPKEVWNILIETRKLSARLAISEKLAEIASTVADAAVDKELPCGRCGGMGTTGLKKDSDEPITCDACWGSGKVLREGSLDHQKMALELGELLNQKVPLVAQQFNSYKGGSGDSGMAVPEMSDWVRSSDVDFERRRPVEAEIVEEGE